MTTFSDQAWQRTAPLRAGIDALPFNTELCAGTLDRSRFQTYIVQDALYLDQYGRALALAAARGPDSATLQQFAQSAIGAVMVERALHERYLTEFGVDPASLATAEPSPDCLGYTSFLMATAYHEPFEVLLAALLKAESDFNTHAVSGAGAQGIAQFMPGTATGMGVRDPFDARENILGGVRYLRVLANGFNGDLVLTIAAYNAGEGAVIRYGRLPGFRGKEHLQAYAFIQSEGLSSGGGPGPRAGFSSGLPYRPGMEQL